MPTYVPTAKIVDERVLASFYRLMSLEAERQGFSSDVFPVVGDLSLSDMIKEMRDQSHSGMRFYDMAMNLANFGVVMGESYVDADRIEPTVVDSYKSWLTDIATDRVMPKLHSAILEQVIKDHPIEGVDWQRASNLTLRRDSLGYAERCELRALEGKLDPHHYAACREVVRPRLVSLELPKVEERYMIPGTGRNFSQAFSFMESGSVERMELYERLVRLHAGFRFRKAA